MRQLRPQAIDGLWQYLCPSFEHNALRPSSDRSGVTSWTHLKPRTRRPFTSSARNCIATSIPSHPPVPNFWKPKHTGRSSRQTEEDSSSRWSGHAKVQNGGPDHTKARERRARTLLGTSSNDIRKLSSPQIHAVLRSEADGANLNRVQEIITILIRQRGEKPDKTHYQALISAQANAEHGSAAEVERLLEEMQMADIELDAGICSAVLKALAIHPHYMLRCHIIKEMERSWYPIEKDDHQHIAAGLLRDLQFELAWDRLKTLQAKGFSPDPWLLNLFVFSFSSIQCLPEAHQVLKNVLLNPGYRVPPALWSSLLHIAAREQYQPMVRDIWNRAVKSGFTNPSSGLCTTVLESCAAYGDTTFAADIFQYLSKRSSPLEIWHYESLLEAYIISGDLEGVLSTIQIMNKAGFPLSHACTRSLFTYLVTSEEMVTDMLGLIAQARNKKNTAPLALVNVVLEATIHQGNLTTAINIVHDLGTLTSEPADCETFNVLLQGCHLAARKDLAMSLANEMRKRGIVPNALTYDRLILVCLSTGNEKDYEDAWRYYDEMQSSAPANKAVKEKQDWLLRRGTVRSMLAASVRHGDKERPYGLIDQWTRDNSNSLVTRQDLYDELEQTKTTALKE